MRRKGRGGGEGSKSKTNSRGERRGLSMMVGEGKRNEQNLSFCPVPNEAWTVKWKNKQKNQKQTKNPQTILCYNLSLLPYNLRRVCYSFSGTLWGKCLEGALSTCGEEVAETWSILWGRKSEWEGECQPACLQSLGGIWVQILISQNMERGSNLCYLHTKGKGDSNQTPGIKIPEKILCVSNGKSSDSRLEDGVRKIWTFVFLILEG